jgi:uncharacterized tellurite resistance protein B-like protein
MPATFTKDEKMALIAILKFIISTDGIITEREIEDINTVARQRGFEDFNAVFNEVDRSIKSISDLKKLIQKITDKANRKKILQYALEISKADANVNPQEIEILKFMSKEWKINIRSLIK